MCTINLLTCSIRHLLMSISIRNTYGQSTKILARIFIYIREIIFDISPLI